MLLPGHTTEIMFMIYTRPNEAVQIADGFVADDRTAMIVVAELYDPDIPNSENTAYINRVKEVIELQDTLLQEGPSGFGKLQQKLTELGNDPTEIVERFQREAKTQS